MEDKREYPSGDQIMESDDFSKEINVTSKFRDFTFTSVYIYKIIDYPLYLPVSRIFGSEKSCEG